MDKTVRCLDVSASAVSCYTRCRDILRLCRVKTKSVYVQLVRLLFWNRHSTEQRVDLDVTWPTDAITSAPATAQSVRSGCVNTAYRPDDDMIASATSSQSTHRCDGLSLSCTVPSLPRSAMPLGNK